MAENFLYYGDNLDILRRHIKDESVDLIYLDPPFNSNQNYNVLFAEHNGSRSAAQIQAFGDTWRWDQAAAEAYEDVVTKGPERVSLVVQSFRNSLGDSDMTAYLCMMAQRLIDLHRVLKLTGSIYLHCDPTASHYLKMILDALFGASNFRTEVVWKRSAAHSDAKQGRRQHGRVHDSIFFYTKSESWTWNHVFTPYSVEYVEEFYRHTEESSGRRYQLDNLTAARPGGDTEYGWRVKRRRGTGARWEADLEDEWKNPKAAWEYEAAPPYKGRYWAYSKENMKAFAREGRLYHTASGVPRYKRYLDEMPGVPLQDVWVDIHPIGARAAERLGYPTQKPEALLERIIKASSNEGDVVLDPFCGCGTAIAVAQRLNRRWIGIDITHLAVSLMKHRLQSAFGDDVDYEVIGEPVSLSGARELADDDPYQFQWWSLGLVGARPVEQKKGADKGIDGRLFFHDEGPKGKTKQIIFSVKAGKVTRSQIHELRGVIERENAEMGVFISLNDATGPMRQEAASAGFYESPGWNKKYPRIQLLTVGELLEGKKMDCPPIRQTSVTFKNAPKAKKAKKKSGRQRDAFEDHGGGKIAPADTTMEATDG